MRFLRRIKSSPDVSTTASLPISESAATDPARGQLVLRPMTDEDLPATSRAHVGLLPFGVFPSLGARFVRRWQRTFLDSGHGVGYVVIDPAAAPDEVVGFLLGTSDQVAHATALTADRRTMASLAGAGCVALFARPRVAARLLRSRFRPWARRLLHRQAEQAEPESFASPQVAVVTALAVHPGWRKSGIGERLVAHFIDHVRTVGATWAELQTSVGPLGAAGFYERLGWRAGSQRLTPDGDILRTYYWNLHGQAEGRIG
ncbi:GNAT family N-acetyltransferase [Micromonospora sp. NPDC050417]|uniref:GNAT family N-acetyltransferase n=1 Tax=Micromonospora sp. NPDC050417 TaxID=3364280 RepID=UPI0037A75BD9